MFGAARWRLTLWFPIAIGLIIVVTGGAVFLSARAVLFDQVNSDLESRAGREQALLATRLLGRHGDAPLADIAIGPAFTSGGYFYALVTRDGELLAGTANVDPAGPPGAGAPPHPVADGPPLPAHPT